MWEIFKIPLFLFLKKNNNCNFKGNFYFYKNYRNINVILSFDRLIELQTLTREMRLQKIKSSIHQVNWEFLIFGKKITKVIEVQENSVKFPLYVFSTFFFRKITTQWIFHEEIHALSLNRGGQIFALNSLILLTS